jgi:hypothetical protein
VTALITELKIRARLRLNASRRDGRADLRLRDCLNQVAREVGFAHWEHGRRVLGGEAVAGDDMGDFWHAPRCTGLLSPWFARYAEACGALAAAPATVLLPYRRQFIVAGKDFVRELGLDASDAAWAGAGRDMVRAYGSGPWLALALQRLNAPIATFSAGRPARP